MMYLNRGRFAVTAPDGWTFTVKLVLLLLVVLVAVTPITQSIWSGDSFLSGHPDTESTLSIALTFVGLVLLLVQRRRSLIEQFLSRLQGLFAVLAEWLARASLLFSCAVEVLASRGPADNQRLSGFELPLLI